jgi:transcription antitermination factor NusA-like protein
MKNAIPNSTEQPIARSLEPANILKITTNENEGFQIYVPGNVTSQINGAAFCVHCI